MVTVISQFATMEFEETPEKTVPLYAALGRMIVEWNSVENHMRRLLASFLGPVTRRNQLLMSHIMTVELGSLGLIHALEAYAEECLPTPEREAVKHATTYFDRLRVYRNYYTHDLADVVSNSETAWGDIRSIDAKSKVVFRSQQITPEDIRFVTKHCHVLLWHLRYLLGYFLHDELVALRAYPPDKLRTPLPDRPPLPDTLQKPGTRPGWQPQSEEPDPRIAQ